jgi:hypothetical protein
VRNAYKILVEKPEGHRPFGRPRQRRKDNMRMALRKVRWEGVDWMHLVQDRGKWWVLVNIVRTFRFH